MYNSVRRAAEVHRQVKFKHTTGIKKMPSENYS